MPLPLKPQYPDYSAGGRDLTAVEVVVLLGLTGVVCAGLVMLMTARLVRTRLIGAGIAAASVAVWCGWWVIAFG
jgi:hypothetical protein